MESLQALLYGVSAQRPSHSLFIGGEQLPLEARMGGIFLGFGCALLWLAHLGRLRWAGLPARPPALVCAALILLMAGDGLNAFLADGRLPHLYAPDNRLRLATGLAAGFALGILALPVVAGTVLTRPVGMPALRNLRELGAGLVGVAALGILIGLEPPPLLWPLAIAMAVSVVAAFTTTNLFLLLTPRTIRARGAADTKWQLRCHEVPETADTKCQWSLDTVDLTGPVVMSFGLSLVELAGLAALRTWLATALGLTWGG